MKKFGVGTRAPNPREPPPLRCRVCSGGCYATALKSPRRLKSQNGRLDDALQSDTFTYHENEIDFKISVTRK